jgi:hypothetical protein
MATLYELTGQMAEIEEALEENGGELTPELEEIWQETAESLPMKVDGYNQVITNMTAYSKNLDSEIKRLQVLKKTADNSVKRVKEHLVDVMKQWGIVKLQGNYCKMSLASSTATEVDEDTVLAPYRSRLAKLDLPDWITADLKVSKTALKEAFKDKDVTPAGVSFVENQSLRIR